MKPTPLITKNDIERDVNFIDTINQQVLRLKDYFPKESINTFEKAIKKYENLISEGVIIKKETKVQPFLMHQQTETLFNKY